MATLADKVLVVLLEKKTQEVEQKEASLKGSSFDTIATAGCNGFLTLSGQQTKPLEILEAILCLHKKDSKLVFPYPKMPFAFFSTSKQVIQHTNSLSLGFQSMEQIPSILQEDPQALKIFKDKIAKLLSDTNGKQVVFLHLEMILGSTTHWIHQILQDYTHGPSGLMLVLLEKAKHPHEVAPNQSSVLRPRQSFEKIDGKYTETTSTTLPRLKYSFYLKDRSRQDLVESFQDEKQMELEGSYGTMDVGVLMKEIAFRLGFAPKYGA